MEKNKKVSIGKRMVMCLMLILAMSVLVLSGCSKKKETKTEEKPVQQKEIKKP